MSYKSLEVYRRAHAFGLACHQLSLRLPKYELYETGSQLRRASKSVSANLVEGYGRRDYPQDYHRFLIVSRASNDESLEWLTYVGECYLELKPNVDELMADNETVGRMLTRLIQSQSDSASA
ncbi:four helix bundle protein [Actomonas aquatica]|uniref:Four helix bundle protein n=1 Tax=Actomonas aquatica TaxID=2866162 RepID=A0ABZ1CAT1_9BACT|nr:four helix bundle protein [Opitutus sp. WL0086]WRQ88576.1 four helix bundle protein [Opitutus sp. WL0086]